MFLQDTIRGRRVSSGFVHAFFGQLRRLMISHEQSLLLAVTVLAILMRCLHARALFYSPISDAWCYVTYAFNIFSGETPDIVTLTFPPGYPIWLFFLTRVLQIPLVNPVLYIQAILNGLATVAIYATAKKLYGQPAGFLAGFFFAIYEPFIFTSGWLMTEALFIPLSAIWLFCLTEYMFNRSTVYLVLTALLIGAIVNVRPNTVFYFLPIVILILIGGCPAVVDKKLSNY